MSSSSLQSRWTTIYRTILPSLAKSRSPVQTSWPVHLDHCFARIILDIAVGIDTPWADKIKPPATKNMTETQLRTVIDLGESIARGEKSLEELDERSLALRGKKGKAGTKRKIGEPDEEDDGGEDTHQQPAKKSRKGEMANMLAKWPTDKRENKIVQSQLETGSILPTREAPPPASRVHDIKQEDGPLEAIRARIATDKSLTPFRARVLTLLTQVPRGRYTTYKALAHAVTTTSSSTSASSLTKPKATSCARAIGSAMRNNPFAPTVPCHRVLAANGKLGGFGGDWGDNGRFADEKRRLLGEEGVKFDGKGKALGSPFVDFT